MIHGKAEVFSAYSAIMFTIGDLQDRRGGDPDLAQASMANGVTLADRTAAGASGGFTRKIDSANLGSTGKNGFVRHDALLRSSVSFIFRFFLLTFLGEPLLLLFYRQMVREELRLFFSK